MAKQILIVSGEHSGDFYGAALARDLRKFDPHLLITGIGSRLMREAGVEILYDSSQWSAVGLLEASVKIPGLLWIFSKLKKYLLKYRVDLIVLIDFPSFNMRLARFAKKHNFPSVYYFPPSAWTEKTDRAIEVSFTVNKVIATFSHTMEIYKKAGREAVFYGHPVMGKLKPSISREEAFELFDISPDKLLVSIFPGSRNQEINHMLPVFIEGAQIIKKKLPELQFTVSCVSEYMEKKIKYYLKKYNFDAKIITGYPYDLMNISYFIIATSGTVTLEAAYFNVPMVIGYKISPLSWFIALRTLHLPPYAGLPNLIAGKEIVPEFIQSNLSPQGIAKKSLEILSDSEKIKNMKEELNKAIKTLGSPDAGEKIAKEIYSMVK
jgi:lipid-A-disaccharide synthase